MIYKIEDILQKLENSIRYKQPFSHIRFGDGGIKFIHAMIFFDNPQLDIIIRKEGIPRSKLVEVFELWGYYARRADFIDTPEVYFQETFWPRLRNSYKPVTEKTGYRLRIWKDLYSRAEFDNENYCNPESNYLMVTRIKERRNLVDTMKNKKIAIITARPEVKSKLPSSYVDVIEIVGHYENQYKNSFDKVVKIIEENAKKYDFWLVAAGELGRIYSGLIKEKGGRTIDIGFIVEFWLGENLHPRLRPFLSRRNDLELELTLPGKRYEDCL
jgi:hypothetical protein